MGTLNFGFLGTSVFWFVLRFLGNNGIKCKCLSWVQDLMEEEYFELSEMSISLC